MLGQPIIVSKIPSGVANLFGVALEGVAPKVNFRHLCVYPIIAH